MTPGPWKASAGYGRGQTEILGGERERGIAMVYWDDNEGGLPHEANARLIAAAPDLLKALSLLVEYVGDPVVRADASAMVANTDLDVQEFLLRVSRAAIAKAGGNT